MLRPALRCSPPSKDAPSLATKFPHSRVVRVLGACARCRGVCRVAGGRPAGRAGRSGRRRRGGRSVGGRGHAALRVGAGDQRLPAARQVGGAGCCCAALAGLWCFGCGRSERTPGGGCERQRPQSRRLGCGVRVQGARAPATWEGGKWGRRGSVVGPRPHARARFPRLANCARGCGFGLRGASSRPPAALTQASLRWCCRGGPRRTLHVHFPPPCSAPRAWGKQAPRPPG